ncbi:MAG TPA: hydantoinase B/oxoprolinase family protein, partial [Lacisediminihabitans sp.]|uniref:hydantoinase B/oxoprolinase family protein n=1 Tax=Lacisediminihabitans sp. TaxID=2787631 RepID=UPI002EDB8610
GVERTSKVINSLKGGFGGAFELDGLDGKDNGYISGVSTPVEYGESEIDVTVLRYALRRDSGGPGRWRGGLGRELVFRIDSDGSNVLARGLERFVFRPWGVAGGKPAAPSELVVNEGRPDEARYQKIDMLELSRGDTVTVRVPGGGGYGDPFLRDPEEVLVDVRQDLVSIESARTDYGVVFVAGNGPVEIDLPATVALRASTARRPAELDGRVTYDVGDERRAWEAVFSPAWYERFVATLFGLPPAERTPRRATLFDAVLAVLPAGFPLPGGTERERQDAAAVAERLLAQLEADLAARTASA